MLSYQTVNSHTLELLKKLTNEEFLSKARLVGGTALALQYGHRISIDLDFFGNIEEDNETIKEILINIGKLSVIKESKNIKIYILDDIKIDFGSCLTSQMLGEYDNKGYTAFMVNICETSSGVHYDIDLISDFCKRNNLFLVVDAVSSFLADYINMSEHGVDVVITGSQKALACPPGIAIITLSGRAVDRVNNNSCKSMYFDLKDMLLNAKRGQTPYTPAITILLQINARLNQIKNDGGVKVEIERTTNLANDFRNKIKEFPFEVRCKCLSNAVTTVHSKEILDVNLVEILKNEYDIWVSTARDDLSKDMIFRVGHMGDLSTEDNDTLIDALRDIQKRGLF